MWSVTLSLTEATGKQTEFWRWFVKEGAKQISVMCLGMKNTFSEIWCLLVTDNFYPMYCLSFHFLHWRPSFKKLLLEYFFQFFQTCLFLEIQKHFFKHLKIIISWLLKENSLHIFFLLVLVKRWIVENVCNWHVLQSDLLPSQLGGIILFYFFTTSGKASYRRREDFNATTWWYIWLPVQ